MNDGGNHLNDSVISRRNDMNERTNERMKRSIEAIIYLDINKF
ncbi:MAG: CHASE3 domain sensor protein [Bacillariaceae sp.]|jgi:CHASE3 domain sensor protein